MTDFRPESYPRTESYPMTYQIAQEVLREMAKIVIGQELPRILSVSWGEIVKSEELSTRRVVFAFDNGGSGDVYMERNESATKWDYKSRWHGNAELWIRNASGNDGSIYCFEWQQLDLVRVQVTCQPIDRR